MTIAIKTLLKRNYSCEVPGLRESIQIKLKVRRSIHQKRKGKVLSANFTYMTDGNEIGEILTFCLLSEYIIYYIYGK